MTGYELREDFAGRAATNVREFLGEGVLDRYTVELRDSYEAIDPADAPAYDRVVLDLPEPWRVVPHAEGVLAPGGILVAYTPSITQAAQARESSGDAGSTPARSRCCTVAGTSRARRCDPTTAWSPTRRSSPSPASSGGRRT